MGGAVPRQRRSRSEFPKRKEGSVAPFVAVSPQQFGQPLTPGFIQLRIWSWLEDWREDKTMTLEWGYSDGGYHTYYSHIPALLWRFVRENRHPNPVKTKPMDYCTESITKAVYKQSNNRGIQQIGVSREVSIQIDWIPPSLVWIR
ncbi:unnamed protein product [Bursaphelenchus xylophilus]|uniref:(pine wood nematode) hypothetical protein n=1 Tax=Bursaphelenchus xylophilus TaxID=6326 RepID=A0A1I7STR4_BURXY|nr:unnamed protein product [Bursaphelenchus xylophilus]CAG9108067.1 unnamed protein product [Bursaphelenchus xylophilus]